MTAADPRRKELAAWETGRIVGFRSLWLLDALVREGDLHARYTPARRLRDLGPLGVMARKTCVVTRLTSEWTDIDGVGEAGRGRK